MHLRQLLQFEAILREGSIQGASRKLNISQPALTKSLMRLEEELGVPLFVRESRGTRPTLYADALRDFANSARVGHEQSVRQIKALKSGAMGTVSILAAPLIGDRLFSSLVTQVRALQPDLLLSFTEQSGNLYESLVEGRHDFLVATINENVDLMDLNGQRLFDDQFLIACAPGHPVEKMDRRNIAALLDYHWIFPTSSYYLRRKIEQMFQSADVPLPSPVAEIASVSVIKSVVETSDYITLIGRSAIYNELRDGRLSSVELDLPIMQRPVGMIWRRNHGLSVAASIVMKTLLSIARNSETD
ncbi:LysR family transcriptional regulator [Sphingomonas oryzagri]|jgi:LysR family transcriptional regulator of gallate degradation|uniref:LysR family transcriptional regulator n=1 Tax=Sphingomonas oryzagri TaxID=3042314 RepID=A0ABT6MY80_9SPHN|nr:LysR family transcriptional regulator [Sphingomonas oryzagri]MDH7637736.1 LysR family transcriptional regulator [Sphingomonas oryzagri]